MSLQDSDPDSPSQQLHSETRDAIVRALATRRPILHHLNADTSWLLQVPRPASAIKHGSRVYYNILIDPWFTGAQVDGASWFSQQYHAIESRVKSVAEVEELILRVEMLAGGPVVRKRNWASGAGSKRGWNGSVRGEMNGNGMGTPVKGGGLGGVSGFETPTKRAWQQEKQEETVIDAVAISHEFTDHCHRETLLEVHKDVPVFATEKAAALITSFNHFRTIVTTPTFSQTDPDWRTHSLSPLPTWLSISRLTAAKDALFYHSALLICFATHPFLPATPLKKRSSLLSIRGMPSSPASPYSSSLSSSSDAAECVIYTPHGITAEALRPIEMAEPALHTLAFLHGLHDVQIYNAKQLNYGAKVGLQAQRMLRAKYWIGTHDEVKKGGGLISWFLKRKVWTVEDAWEEARKEALASGEMDVDGSEVANMRFEEVGNGESRILE